MSNELHVSGLTKFQECERAWHYQYMLGYQAAAETDPITFGNWGHYALRLVASGYTYAAALDLTNLRRMKLDEQYNLYPKDELWADFTQLMQAHELWAQGGDNLYADSKLRYISLETKFSCEVGGYRLGGQWDGLAEHTHLDGLFVVERKFTRNPNQLERGIRYDYQPRLYAWAVEQTYQRPVTGVIYEIIRRTNPYKVKMLKSGLPSKARTELDGTTYEVYRQLLESTGADLDDYQDALTYLKINDNPIFRRVLVQIPDTWKQQAAHTMYLRAAQMEAAQAMGSDAPAKLNRYTCEFCPYKYVCAAQDDGVDWVELLDATFIKHRERFDAVETEE